MICLLQALQRTGARALSTFALFPCQTREASVGPDEQNQQSRGQAVGLKLPKKCLYWANVTMPWWVPGPPKGHVKGSEGGFVLASFSPLSYPPRMTEPAPKLTLATPDDLADSLSFALRHEGRKSQHDSDK